MADLKKAIESNDAPAMSRAMDALMQAQHKASEALYKTSRPARAAQGATAVRTVRAGADSAVARASERSRRATSSTPKWWRRQEITDG